MAVDAGKSETEMNHAGSDLSANGGQPGVGVSELKGGATVNGAPHPTPSGPGTAEPANAGSDSTHHVSSSDDGSTSSPDPAPVDGSPKTAPAAGLPGAAPVNGPPDADGASAAGLPDNTPAGSPAETAPVAAPPNDTPVDGTPGAAPVGDSPNTVPTASALDGTAVNSPTETALVVSLPDDTLVDDLSSTGCFEISPYLLFDEGGDWPFPPWSPTPNSFFPRITPEEEERAEALLRQLLDRTGGKPWRIGTKFITKAAAGPLRGKTEWLRARAAWESTGGYW